MERSQPDQVSALISYIVPLVGSVLVLRYRRTNRFAAYHAGQAFALWAVAFIAPVAWLVVSWLMAWVPLVGPVLAAATFSLVIAVYVVLIVAWVIGIVYVTESIYRPLPVFGRWGERATLYFQ